MGQASRARNTTRSKARKTVNESTHARGNEREQGGEHGRENGRDGSADGWLDTFIPYRLYRTTARLNGKLLTRLRSLRINPSRWRVLSVLKAYGPLSIGEIAEATLTEQPTISRVVSQLEREGRVIRRLSPVDSRVAQISLTRQGIDAFNQIAPTALKHEELAIRDISRKDIAALLAILNKIENNIQISE